MKRLTVIIILAFSAVIVFFSLFGDAIYHLVTADVKTYTVSAAVMSADGPKLVLPKECVHDGRVLLIEAAPAFERTVFTVKSVEVTLRDGDHDGSMYLIESGLRQGDRVVLECAKELKDGERVEPQAE